VNPRPGALGSHPEIVHFRANAVSKEEVGKAVGELKFDIIIDDASHIPAEQMKTMELLLPRLNVGGICVVEDVGKESDKLAAFCKGIVIDLRKIKGRFDDVMVVVLK
jgi:cephalosporin hydroxylase